MSTLAVEGGTPVRREPFPSWPVWDEHERNGLLEVLDQGIWSNGAGPKVSELEATFAAFHDAAFGIAAPNGTISLEIAMAALGIGSGDEVIVPPYTFYASASAVLKMNALPIFVDISLDSYCIDPDAVEAAITPRTRAVIPVHLGGHPADMDRLLEIKRKHGIAIIEDAAHAHGSSWNGRKVGAIGDFGAWSFQASKNMTAGEGGMLTTNDPELAERARSFHDCGRVAGGKWYEHAILGGNYRLTEFQSVLLLAQLARLPEHIERREQSAAYLDRELSRFDGIRPLPRDPRVTAHAYHLYVFRFIEDDFGAISRDDFVAAMRAEGIPASTGYPIPLNCQPVFTNRAFDTRATNYDPNYAPTQFERLELPACLRACAETVWLMPNMLLGSSSDMEDIVTAVHKIHDVAQR